MNFTNTEELQNYINTNSDLFLGKTIDKIYINKIYCEEDYFEFDNKIRQKIYWDKNVNEDVELEIDKNLTLKISDIYINIENEWNNQKENTDIKVSVSPTIQDCILDISHYYSKNIIGHKIVKITTDDYNILTILLNNGFEFNVFVKACDLICTHEWVLKDKKQIDYEKLYLYEKYPILNDYINSIKQD